jgi:hypothetical protein
MSSRTMASTLCLVLVWGGAAGFVAGQSSRGGPSPSGLSLGRWNASDETTVLTNSSGTPWSAAGPVTINSGTYSGSTDYNNGGTTNPAQSLSGTTNSSGTVSLTGLNALSFSQANSFVNYAVDGNRVVSISIDQGLLALGTLESVKQ